jgi:tRNA 5-methylaminomethyl-2-thiouridine biosynthesis bifunctional protein
MTKPQHHAVVVIGAGIAGATIANELLERGQAVCIIDAASSPATACSNHAHAIAHPHIGKGSPRLLRLTRIAFLLAESRWGATWNQHGIFQPSKKDRIFDQAEVSRRLCELHLDDGIAMALNSNEAEALCGVKHSGVWLPRGASLDLSKAAQELLKPHPNLRCYWDTRITRLEKCNLGWMLFNSENVALVSASKVVIAAAMESKALVGTINVRLPLRPVRGQLSIFSISANDPWIQKLPRIAITGDGYCLPAERLNDGSYRWIVGSSFDEGEDDLQARDSSDEFNRIQAKGLVNYGEGNSDSLKRVGNFIGIRCVAGDRLPIIGALTQRPGIFLATALGSRGALWSALAAKLISAQVLDDDFALLARFGFAADLVAALAPARFFAGALAVAPALGTFASNSKPILPSGPKAK